VVDRQTVRPFRGVSRQTGESCSAVHAPASTSFRTSVQRFRGDSIGPFLVQALPVQPLPFPAGLCGFSLSPSPPVLKPMALLSADCRAPRSLPSVRQPDPPALGESTSPGVPSPTALDSSGCPYAPEVPPSGTIRPQGFSPSRRLASPKTMRASSRLTSLKPCGLTTMHARCAPGVPPDLHRSPGIFRSPAGRWRPASLFKAFSSPATNPFWRALLSHASLPR